jgi:hypothetical protein
LSFPGAGQAFSGIEQIKVIFQRIHNLGHTVGMLAAKAFLGTQFPSAPSERIEFAENANKSGADLRLSDFELWPNSRPRSHVVNRMGHSRKRTLRKTYGSYHP